jgi:tetratricopeptide (TPR) repeat protein
MTDQNQQSLLLGKIAAYTEILVKDPNSTIFVSLAETYRKMGMFDDALQIIHKGLERHADFSPAHIVLARVLCQLEDYAGSVAAFEQALALDSESLAALVGYARVKILLGDETDAREILLRARNLSPADPVINKLLLSLPAEFIDEDDDRDEQSDVSASDDTRDIDSPNLVSQTLAELYLAQGLTEKALELFQKLSQNDPDNLVLRRKVKELENQLNRDHSISEDEIVADGSDSLNEVVNNLGEADVPKDEGFTEGNVLDTLNRWLANIQQRRKNV